MVEREEVNSELNGGKCIDIWPAIRQIRTAKIRAMNKIVSKESKQQYSPFKIAINLVSQLQIPLFPIQSPIPS